MTDSSTTDPYVAEINSILDALNCTIGPWREIECWPQGPAILLDVDDHHLRITPETIHGIVHELRPHDDCDSPTSDALASALDRLHHTVTNLLIRHGTVGTAEKLGWVVSEITAGPATGYIREHIGGGLGTNPEYREALAEILSSRSPTSAHTSPLPPVLSDILGSHADRLLTAMKTDPTRTLVMLPIPYQEVQPFWAARLTASFADLWWALAAGTRPDNPTCTGDRVALRMLLDEAADDLNAAIAALPEPDAEFARDAADHLDQIAGDPWDEAKATNPDFWFLA